MPKPLFLKFACEASIYLLCNSRHVNKSIITSPYESTFASFPSLSMWASKSKQLFKLSQGHVYFHIFYFFFSFSYLCFNQKYCHVLFCLLAFLGNWEIPIQLQLLVNAILRCHYWIILGGRGEVGGGGVTTSPNIIS